MKIKAFVTLIFLNLYYLVLAGSPHSREKDSLLNAINNTRSDTIKAKSYVALANLYIGANSDSILIYSDLALNIIENGLKNSDERTEKVLLTLKGDALNNRGYAYCHLGDYLKGLADYRESLKVRAQVGNKEGVAESLNNIAVVYDEHGDPAKAIDYYLKSLKILEEIDEKYGMGYILNNIAFVYKYQGDISKAVDYSKRALEIRKQINDRKGIAESLNSLGLIETDKGDLDSALVKFETALKIGMDLGAKRQSANSLINIGRIYLKKKEYHQAMEYFKKSLVIGEELKDLRNILNSNLAISEVYLDMGDVDAAINNGKKALSIGKEVQQPEVIHSASDLLQKIYKKKGDYKKALEMYELSVQMKDSILSTENKRASMQKEFQYLYEKKAATDSIRNAEQIKLEEVKHEQEISRQRSYAYGGIGASLLMLLVAGVSYRAFRNKKRANKIIEMQKVLVEQKQKEIVDSINYAKRIQYALLANEKMFNKNLSSYFILFAPKDIVSGDFYWAAEKNEKFFLAVCDCTGHGVPGAFMSLLNISFLNEAINERNISEPHDILNYVRQRLIENISNDGAQDGMDASILCIDKNSGRVAYAAANNAPVLVRNNEMIQLPADKMPVGKGLKTDSFRSNIIETQKGDTLYFYTDGYADQFGGEKGKKFKYKQLHKMLTSFNGLEMGKQKKELEKTFNDWKGDLEQVDDVCIIGVRISD
jgi:serine phosphatase RsbU (regulator of sigma subunit)/tetratricopeptide (TPR) repeat protein